ncbi:MAG TPA: TatD family hydrolase [Candidatus Methylacidiphilales bacterium]|jgi:TatD DNase family protein|nr:TatD family hydrolase [Candidatus Methylacidiphilales bacterium]
MLIDTHAHLDYTDYDPDRPEVIARATAAGVTEIVSIGTRIDSSARAVELAENFPNIWATVGIHPCEVDEAPDDAVERLRALARDSSRVVAVGEIGLDYHRLPENPAEADANKRRQADLFRRQLELTAELGLNAVIHQRDSWDDTLKILSGFTGKVRGVFHCFGGTLAQAREVIALGHLVSFTGIVTFKNARQVQETARDVAFDQFMVETDCPYLAPAPDRGKRCEPAHTRRVAEQIAQLRGVPLEEVAARTTETAREFFKFRRNS